MQAVLKEALMLNAIAHKDYSGGSPIQNSVYDDRIMFWNDGHLSEHWTIDKLLRKHPSQPYNPDIANAFFRAGLIESWGRGVDVMVQACREYGLPDPVLRYDDSGFRVEFTGKTPDMILDALRKDSSLTIPQLAWQISKSESAIERAIRKLRKEGKLERVGPAKGGVWKVLNRGG